MAKRKKRTPEQAIREKINRWARNYGLGKKALWNRAFKLKNCIYCGLPLDAYTVSLDHKVPTSRGGKKNDPNNIQFVHMRCNDIKGNMTHLEYKGLLTFLNKPYMREQRPVILARLKLGWRAQSWMKKDDVKKTIEEIPTKQ